MQNGRNVTLTEFVKSLANIVGRSSNGSFQKQDRKTTFLDSFFLIIWCNPSCTTQFHLTADRHSDCATQVALKTKTMAKVATLSLLLLPLASLEAAAEDGIRILSTDRTSHMTDEEHVTAKHDFESEEERLLKRAKDRKKANAQKKKQQKKSGGKMSGKGKSGGKMGGMGKGYYYDDHYYYQDDEDDAMMGPVFIQTAGCYLEGACIYSHNPEFSLEYGLDDTCDWTVSEAATLQVEYFFLEDGFDFLTVAGIDFTGDGLGLDGLSVFPGDTLLFTSDFINAASGFKVCLV